MQNAVFTLTFHLVLGNSAGKLFVVEELKISQILKQCKLLACAWSHAKALPPSFSSTYFAVKVVEKLNVSVSLDFSHLKGRH